MRLLRFYLPLQLTEGRRYALPDNVFRHVIRVLRLTVNQELTLFNGDNKEYRAKLVEVNKKSAEVEILSSVQLNRESPLKINLIQGISKGERMDFVLQKATELGVTSIYPVLTERTNVAISQQRTEKKLGHWQGVITSACEQCGRNVVPQLMPLQPIASALGEFSQQTEAKYVLSPSASSNLLYRNERPSELTVLIGPEGGLSNQELGCVVGVGFAEVSLGPRILRTETATLAFLAMAQGMWGDLT